MLELFGVIVDFPKYKEFITKNFKRLFIFYSFYVLFSGILRINVICDFFLKLLTFDKYTSFIEISRDNFIFFLVIYVIIILAYLWYIFLGKPSIDILVIEAFTKLHDEFIYLLRNDVVELENYQQEVEDSIYYGNLVFDPEEELLKLENILSQKMQLYVDFVSDYLSKDLNDDDEYTTTVKILLPEDSNKVKTIARSSNTKNYRKRDNEIMDVQACSDFNIIKEGLSFCYQSNNLKDDYDNKGFSLPDDYEQWSKKFISSITMPIRYLSLVDDKYCSEHDLLGFIYIDSENIQNKNWGTEGTKEFEMLSVVADGLYLLLAEYTNVYFRIKHLAKQVGEYYYE